MNQEQVNARSQFIFIGSITLAGVCATIVALFQALNTDLQTIADEVLCIDTCLFLFCSLFSFLNLKYPKYTSMATVTDYVFFIALGVITLTGIILIL